MSNTLDKIKNWLEEEVTEGEEVIQAYDDLSEATYPNDVYHIGRHACAKQLLTQINKWEIADG